MMAEMKNSNKKIEKIGLGIEANDNPELTIALAYTQRKLNEVIDKVNELSDRLESQPENKFNESLGKLMENDMRERIERDMQEVPAFTKLGTSPKKECPPEEPKKECEHEPISGNCDGELKCGLCGAKKNLVHTNKQVVSTSEGDAVGEVEKKHELINGLHDWFHKDGTVSYDKSGDYSRCRNCGMQFYIGGHDTECSGSFDLTRSIGDYEPKKD